MAQAKDYAMAILPIDQIQSMLDAIEQQATASMGSTDKRSAKEQWDELRQLLNQVRARVRSIEILSSSEKWAWGSSLRPRSLWRRPRPHPSQRHST